MEIVKNYQTYILLVTMKAAYVILAVIVAVFLISGCVQQKSEANGVANTPSNTICQKIPLIEQTGTVNKYYCLAVVNKNPEFCNDMDDEEDQVNLCRAVASADTSYCKNMHDPMPKHVCYYQTAVISGNINICDEIDYDDHEQEECYYNFISNLHWWDRSDKITTEYCNKFPVSEQRDTCLAFKDNDVSLCKNNINCLTSFKQDMSFCTGKGSTLEYCIRDRAMTDKDLSICETLTGEKRDDCIGDFCTHIILDTAICDKISDIHEKQSRYVEVAIHTANNVRGNV